MKLKWPLFINRLKNLMNKLKDESWSATMQTEIGFCPICEKEVTFRIEGSWLRDQFKCNSCESIPRNRALIHVLKLLDPHYKEKIIHESSPGGAASSKLAKDCPKITFSHYYPDVEYGTFKNGVRCENLECMTFADESFDIFITQDVMEHVLHPDLAFKEIARVLKPGGMHIFTVPLYKGKETQARVIAEGDTIQYVLPKVFHGNPIDSEGSLVITDWGYDIVNFIYKHSGMRSTIYLVYDRYLGLDGEHLEVVVSRKY